MYQERKDFTSILRTLDKQVKSFTQKLEKVKAQAASCAAKSELAEDEEMVDYETLETQQEEINQIITKLKTF